MKKEIIVAIGAEFIKNQLITALKYIEFIDIVFIEKNQLNRDNSLETTKFIKNEASAVIISNISNDDEVNNYLINLKSEIGNIPLIPIKPEMLQEQILNINIEKATKILTYFSYGGLQNIINVLYYISLNFLKISLHNKNQCKKVIKEPEKVPFDGIVHIDTTEVFTSFKDYSKWYIKDENVNKYRWIGILTHRQNWNNDNMNVEKELIKSFEKLGFKVITVFSYASLGGEGDIKDFDEIVNEYFSINENLIIDGLVNFQMLAALATGEERDIFKKVECNFKQMNIPIFKPVISIFQDEDSWMKNENGMSSEIPWAFTNPEMAGMIEPIIIGCKDKNGVNRAIKERISRFTNRVLKWIDLRYIENKNKKIAMFIHSAPCSGVEATIGLGVGLDVFESVVNILKKFKNEGYYVEDIPKDGTELHRIIMNKKAYQDFRWTSVEDIVEAGGALYKMDLYGENGYLQFYNELEKDVIEEIKETWGDPPGEGMVFKEKIIITGISFGNVTVMVQPKRGCYGAKCTGEVCKILHDPKCPPPHQYIATYKYVQNIMKANAIVHVGTGGSLEYLPGKPNALSNKCYPDVVLGTSPNLYVYNAGVGGEGTIAKRRNNAVIIDYLPASININGDSAKIINLICEYIEAEINNSNQKELLKESLLIKIDEIDGARGIVASENNFIEGLNKLKGYLMNLINNSSLEKLHVLGQNPNLKEMTAYIYEYINKNSLNSIHIKALCKSTDMYNILILEFISECISNSINFFDEKYNFIEEEVLVDLKDEILCIHKKLKSVECECENLILALEGKFIEPGIAGMPEENLKEILPTGRNFYTMDCKKIPTMYSYKIGCKLADNLLNKYIEEEGELPKKVAMNMISTDISMSKGEQLSQILYLMGIIPIWDENNKVIDLKPIALDDLKRPRIDVTVRISGVLRDTYPDIVKLIDKAVVIASSLDESFENNFVKMSTYEIAKELKNLDNENIKRRSTMRIFGSRPGTYGAGVDLALKASAWKNEKDIGKTFIYFSSYAYGEELNGYKAEKEFVENVKKADIAYDITNSKRYDVLACGFSASVYGGFNTIKKLISGKEMKQYHGKSEDKDNIQVHTLKEEIKETMNKTFFNPLWKENVKKKGYIGASEFMRRIQNIFDFQCLSHSVDDTDIDRLVDLYINDDEMKMWFKDNNQFAAEEISRRFLELYERKKWNANNDTLNSLRKSYIKIEGDMEELSENCKGEIQGGEVEILNSDDIESWKSKINDINKFF